jgi:hypothetical protein
MKDGGLIVMGDLPRKNDGLIMMGDLPKWKECDLPGKKTWLEQS